MRRKEWLPSTPALLSFVFLLAGSASGLSALEVPARPAPAAELRTATGQPLRLSDFLGKVILVDFWAS